MKSLILLTFFISQYALAVPQNSVYPNSGSTEAQTDPVTDIDGFSGTPIDQGAGIQRMENGPRVDPDAMEVGPYDRDGNYRPSFKKADAAPL